MKTELKTVAQQPTRRYHSFEEFRDAFYRSAERLSRQMVEEQTASFGKRLAKQIIRGESSK